MDPIRAVLLTLAIHVPLLLMLAFTIRAIAGPSDELAACGVVALLFFAAQQVVYATARRWIDSRP